MLEIKNLYSGYDEKDILKDINFKVKNGENLCIVGPNGCGKSTLLKSIANLLEYRGSVMIYDEEVSSMDRKEFAKKVGLMSQITQIYFPYTIYDTVSLDFLHFGKDSIYIDFRSQVYTVFSNEVRRISSTELANLFSFVSQMAKE